MSFFDLKADIQSIYDEHEGRYGYRRIRDELANRGQKVNHKKVQRIMKELGLNCLVRTKKYKSYKGTVVKIAPNILDLNFTVVVPNEKWTTDSTEFKLFGEKFYLSPVKTCLTEKLSPIQLALDLLIHWFQRC